MLKKKITYTDYNGQERTEEFFFNLTESELLALDIGEKGLSFTEKLERLRDSMDADEVLSIFTEFLKRSYGRKSDDGRIFEKSDEIWLRFKQSPAYDVFLLELMRREDAATEFLEGLMPAHLIAAAKAKEEGKTPQEAARENMQGYLPKQDRPRAEEHYGRPLDSQPTETPSEMEARIRREIEEQQSKQTETP